MCFWVSTVAAAAYIVVVADFWERVLAGGEREGLHV
jgi:hypothetical protein